MTNKDAVIQSLALVPKGKVVTYGQLAKMAGLGNAARYVGTLLKQLPEGSSLPWHRVINSQGRISFPEDHPGYQRQRDLLMEEGVVFLNGKIDLKRFGI